MLLLSLHCILSINLDHTIEQSLLLTHLGLFLLWQPHLNRVKHYDATYLVVVIGLVRNLSW